MGHLAQLLKRIQRTKKTIPVKTVLTLTPYQPLSDKGRFTQSYEQTNSCWNWTGSLDRYGYGKFKIGQHTYKAHRYSYQQYYGDFDEKLHVLHRCDNPCCVNPNHLFLGTNRDNVADRTAKNRHGVATRRLTESEKQSICFESQKFSTRRLADQYNVHISTIRRILKNPRYSRFKHGIP